MILEAKHLSFQYEKTGRKILDQFSLKADSNERVGILAPSGFGKTTLCKILSGYEEPESGEVILDGKPLQSYKDYCSVQMIWQHPEQAVNPRLRMRTVLEEGDQVDPKLIEKLGIERDWMNRFPTELSGGELQRFCIARALGKRTRFLLADEISTMLDLVTQSQIWHFLIEETQKRGIGMIVVSHNPELVEKVCTRVVMLDGQHADHKIHPLSYMPLDAKLCSSKNEPQHPHQKIPHAGIADIFTDKLQKGTDRPDQISIKRTAHYHFLQIGQMPEKHAVYSTAQHPEAVKEQ